MDKPLLKVTRFNNSDVIATSGDSKEDTSCTHPYHMLITRISDGIIYYNMYENGQYSFSDDTKPGQFNFTTGPEENKMYGAGEDAIFSECNWTPPAN